jgi:hypothetical protein
MHPIYQCIAQRLQFIKTQRFNLQLVLGDSASGVKMPGAALSSYQ